MSTFYDQPILNSPYEKPRFHHPLDARGQPLGSAPAAGLRPSRFIVPVPKAKKGGGAQGALDLDTYSDNAIINEIRAHVDAWRELPGGAEWGVTATTRRLLEHWRHHRFANQRPFFCQIEAVETLIWLTEVARFRRQYASLWRGIEAANAEANPELLRLALKMATGAGKTTVMALIIAWQTLNAVRMPNSDRFARAFLVVTPGITIRDRLQVLRPEHPDNYYRSRELVPGDMLAEIAKATIVITNYHAFQHRERLELSRIGRAFLQGNDPRPPQTRETDGQMLERACGKLLAFKNIVVLNDEAHHCYRQRALSQEEKLDREGQAEARENNETARLWISGIEALKRKVGLRAVYDLSATPFFLRGSGYREGTLFPWVVSDFSLMDAIECGIVKLPRIPVADNLAAADEPIYRNMWQHVGRDLLRTRHPLDLPAMLQTALYALYSNYETYYREWEQAGVGVPPVFIVVCQNTAISRLIYDWIAGFERQPEDGETIAETRAFHPGALKLFANYDQDGQPLSRPHTLLIDSRQIEAGDALDPKFREAAALEIEAFKAQRNRERGAGEAAEPSDAELIANAIVKATGERGKPRAVLDPYQPTGSTASVNFQTTRPVWTTDPRKSHVSHVVLDSDWEAELARVLEAHPAVVAYAKNQGMQFEIPYRIGRVVRRYTPDFLARVDLGGALLNLVLEVKGYRGLDAQMKQDTMETLWVPGVNGIGTFGSWAFGEFRQVFTIKDEFAALLDRLRPEMARQSAIHG